MYAARMQSAIIESSSKNLKILEKLWVKMGLSNDEIDERIKTVNDKITKITTEMVECDIDNMKMIEENCDVLKQKILDLQEKLSSRDLQVLPSKSSTLMEQYNNLKQFLMRLEKKRAEIMEQFRPLMEEEKALAQKLDMLLVVVDEDAIPDEDLKFKIEENIRKMNLVKEDRELRMFKMKEQVVQLLDTLGIDMNATSLSAVLDGDSMGYSLRPGDLKKVELSIEEFTKELDNKRIEVKTLIREIFRLYARLNISPSGFHILLSSGKMDDVDNLIQEQKLNELKMEKVRLIRIMEKNVKDVLDNAMVEVSVLWKECYVGEQEKSAFIAKIGSYSDEHVKKLEVVDHEIAGLNAFYTKHKKTFQIFSKFMELCELAKDLKERLQDPSRLFKSRGQTLLIEEQDRKKVNTIPKRKDELLALVEVNGDLKILDSTLSVVVETNAQMILDLFPPMTPNAAKKTISRTTYEKSEAKSSTPFQIKKCVTTPTSSKTKRLGKFYTSPVGRNVTKALRATPRLAKRLPVSATKIPKEVTLASLNKVKTNEINSDYINEDVFCDNIPLSSTMCKASTGFVMGEVLGKTDDLDNNNKPGFRVLPREKLIKSEKAPLGESRIQEVHTLISPKKKRKLRRSNSISDLVNKERLEQLLAFKSARKTASKRARKSKSCTDSRSEEKVQVKLVYHQPIEPSTSFLRDVSVDENCFFKK